MHFNFRRISIFALIAAAVFAAGTFSIADLDFWWHLKTGEVIVETGEFQRTEIYSFTAFGREYIDHEWLFQVSQHFAFSLFGPPGVIFLKCIILICILWLTTSHLFQNGASAPIVIGIQFLALSGSISRIIERPEIFSALFFVLTFLLIDRFLKTRSLKWLYLVPPVFVLWANFHAAVILGLLLQAAFIAGLVLEYFLRKNSYPAAYGTGLREMLAIGVLLFISFLASLINPYGLRTLMVPFELTSIIDSGILKNEEWLPPFPLSLPFYYVCVLFAAVVVVANFRNLFPVQFILMAFFGYISMKYIRNTGMFCWFMPLFVAPYVARLSKKPLLGLTFAGISTIFVLYLVTAGFPFQRGLSVASYFPQKLSQFTKSKNLQGNLFNSYAFGGYLIWSFYPERKIFIDGRNEVFLPLLQELMKVRSDSRYWTRFLDRFQIQYALLNYVDNLQEVTVLDTNMKPTITYMPFTESHFPRSRWALIFWNDEGMIFIRRNGVNKTLLNLEYKSVYPEGRDYQQLLLNAGKVRKIHVMEELKRRLSEDPSCTRAQKLMDSITGAAQ